MADVRFALTFIISMMSTYFHRDQLLEEYLGIYNEEIEVEDSIKAEIDSVLSFVEACDLPANSRGWRTSDLLTLLVELHFSLFKENKDLYSSAVREQLNKFYNEVDNRRRLETTEVPASVLDEYFRASIQATNDRLNRVRRGEILQRVITGKSFDSLVEGQD